MRRNTLVALLCNLVGDTICRVVELRDGWPSIIEVRLPGGLELFSAHVARISTHSRKDYEYRFQNPAESDRPAVMALPGTTPLLLGLWLTDNPSVIVAAQPEIRLGDTTRFSVLFPERLFREAQQYGWADPYRNNNGNLHWSFLPSLLPAFIDLYRRGASVDAMAIQIAAKSSGLIDEQDDASARRARETITRLVRDAEFGRSVVAAYDGLCAMCGINLGLVSGAHILPVKAPNSVDEVWNGLALCENHHRAFDSHRLWVGPDNRRVAIHPSIIAHAESNERTRLFVDTTFDELVNPVRAENLPRAEMFIERYQYFDDYYDWA